MISTLILASNCTMYTFPKNSLIGSLKTHFFLHEKLHSKTTSFTRKKFVKHTASSSIDSTILAPKVLSWKQMKMTWRIQVQTEDAMRPLAHFLPDIWGDRFSDFSVEDNLKMLNYAEDIEKLKDKVRIMMLDNSIELAKKMTLIDTMERLGISYFYESEIKEILDKFFEEFVTINFNIDYNLSDTALQFRIFRQHGYNMPCDVFKKFIDSKGKINKSLKNDFRGMLNLYEASHLRVHGEDILEEAYAFSADFLESNAKHCKQSKIALKHPLHFSASMVQIRHYISSYEEDQSRDETLVRLAKINFNRLQLLHRQELSQFLKWWNSQLADKFPYCRQRSVDCHLWALALYFEPQYSLARILVAKMVVLLGLLDDTYDAYGTFEELELLTQAFHRWGLGEMSELPHNMKVVFELVINTFDEFAKELSKREIPNATQFVKDCLLRFIIKGSFKEAEWLNADYIPSFEEYLVVGRITSGMQPLAITSLVGMKEIVDENSFKQITATANKAISSTEIIARLLNDIISNDQVQKDRRHIPSAVECCMEEYGMTREKAVQLMKKKIQNSWKDLNSELLIKGKPGDQHLPKLVLKRIINLARLGNYVYSEGKDGFTNSAQVLKDDIIATYDKPFPI